MPTAPVLSAFGVEVGILIEWDGPRGVFAAEDVAAVSAVVPALEEGESLLANGGITDNRVGVGFPV